MKNHLEIAKEIKEIKVLSYFDLKKEYQEKIKNLEFRSEAQIQARKEYEELCILNEFNSLKTKVLYNNYCIALANDLLPTIKEIFIKYNGKKNGEKTKEKLNNDLSVALPEYYIYFRNNGFYIENKNFHKRIEIELNYNNFLVDADNKYTIEFLEELSIRYYVNYIEDVNNYVLNLKSKMQELNAKKEEFEKLISEYNKFARIEGILSPYATFRDFSLL